MALANYEVTAPGENGEAVTERLTRHGAIKRLAPGFDLNDAMDVADAEAWLDQFAADELAQRAQKVQLEVFDVREMSTDADDRLATKLDEVTQIKEEIASIAAEYLRELTAEEVNEGEIHTVAGSKNKVDAIEVQRRRIGKSASKVLEENPNLPSHVRGPLEEKAARDQKATAERMSKAKK